MKNLMALWIMASLALVSIAGAQTAELDFSLGINALSVTNLDAANLDFSNAVTLAPTNPTNNVFFAFTRVLTLPDYPTGSNFLTRIGLSASGRNIYHWHPKAETNENGHLAVPLTTPPLDADEFTSQLRMYVLPVLVAAGTNLGQVTATNFTVDLTTNETHEAAVTLDWGDIQMLQAIGDASQLIIYTTYSWNLDAELLTVSNVIANDASVESVLTTFPSLLTTAWTGDLPAAQGAFTNAINSYFAASQFIRARPPGEVRLFNLDAKDLAEELHFRQTLSNLLASVNGPVPLTNSPGDTVSAKAFFSGNFDLRSYLPQFQDNAFVWGSFSDPTFGGVVGGLTEKQLGKPLLKHFQSVLDVPGTSLSVLYTFTNYDAQSAVIPYSDGSVYGTMEIGGPFIDMDPNGFGYGSVFKITSSGQFITLYNFGEITNEYGYPLDGAYPSALVLGSDGNFYGTTAFGGTNDYGTVFMMTPSGQLTNLYNFYTAADNGANTPAAALVEGSDGRFYGTTLYGGESDGNGYTYGIIFAITTNGAFTYLNSFSSESVNSGNNIEYYQPFGGYPMSPLMKGNDGNLYGATTFGGDVGTNFYGLKGTTNYYTNIISGYGTIFKLNPTSGQLSVLYTFGTLQDAFGDPLDGAVPNALVQVAGGDIYGTTQFGGANDDFIGLNGGYILGGYGSGDGTLFRISPTENNSFTNLLSFDENFLDGYYPFGPLIPGSGGVFYGGVSGGGANNGGAVFVFNTNNVQTNIVWLDKSSGDYGPNLQLLAYIQGSMSGNVNPVPPLLTPGLDGNFYGTTTDDGTNGSGTVYVLNISAAAGPQPPVIESVTRSGQIIQFTWSATAGSMYQVQYKTNLLQSKWADLGASTNALGASLSATDSIANSQRFYRIELLP
jgi:uncharacterized repeat protein (TIGR03803 family)